jgi:hypothetical protein
MAKSLEATAGALELQKLIRSRGDYEHVIVRPRAGHLSVELTDEHGVRDIVARATPVSNSTYGLSFRNHAGRWEPMPVYGGLQDIAEGLTDFLGPYLTV